MRQNIQAKIEFQSILERVTGNCRRKDLKVVLETSLKDSKRLCWYSWSLLEMNLAMSDAIVSGSLVRPNNIVGDSSVKVFVSAELDISIFVVVNEALYGATQSKIAQFPARFPSTSPLLGEQTRSFRGNIWWPQCKQQLNFQKRIQSKSFLKSG